MPYAHPTPEHFSPLFVAIGAADDGVRPELSVDGFMWGLAKRIEFRVPDPSSNPYLAFSAMTMAGIDGVKNKIEPMAPVDKDLYELPPDELANIPQVPGSLTEVLDALEKDNDYLQAGGVFPADLIETWVDYKRSNEVDPIRLRPHPHEFEMYYDI